MRTMVTCSNEHTFEICTTTDGNYEDGKAVCPICGEKEEISE